MDLFDADRGERSGVSYSSLVVAVAVGFRLCLRDCDDLPVRVLLPWPAQH